MPLTRRDVLVQLAAESDATREEMTNMATLASALDAAEDAISEEIDGLVACELAIRDSDDRVRVTVTGEELLDLDTENGVVVDLTSK